MVDVGREACKIRRVEACPISYSKKGFALWPIPFSGVESEKKRVTCLVGFQMHDREIVAAVPPGVRRAWRDLV